jgi:FkbM family methyltransferase
MPRVIDVVKSLAFSAGVDLRRAENCMKSARSRLFQALEIDLVIDVGANEGQYAKLLRARGYQGQIVSFEPIPKAFNSLSSAFAKDANWKGHNIALADTDGISRFNVSANSVSSSLLEVTSRSTAALNATQTLDAIDVRVQPLHQVMGGKLVSKNVHLKLDTQGSELSVIDGCGPSLAEIKSIECELSFVELYAGQPLVFTVMDRLYREGFRVVWIEGGFQNQQKELLQADALFVR